MLVLQIRLNSKDRVLAQESAEEQVLIYSCCLWYSGKWCRWCHP